MSAEQMVVTEAQAGDTLAAVVRDLLGAPWSQAKRLVKTGRVSLDGERALDPAARVAAGQRVEVNPSGRRLRAGVLAPEAVLHEDGDVIVVVKPAGTLTVPYDPEDRDTLLDQVRGWLRRADRALERGRRGRPGRGRRARRDPWVGVVQRLDKDTTGVLVFARTKEAMRSLKEQLRVHSVTRRYLAIVHGRARTATYTTHIVQDRGDGLRGSFGARPWHRGEPPADAKRSVTHVRPLQALAGATLVECRLETGRQHQIRIHLSEAGHPLVGEPVYIRDLEGPRIEAPRPMLHAAELAFDHPRTGQRAHFASPAPEDFQRVLRRLRGERPPGGDRPRGDPSGGD